MPFSIKNLFSKQSPALLIPLAAYLFCSSVYSPPLEGLGYDREIFQYMGMIQGQGLYPYTHAIDHKPPVIYILNYAGFLLSPGSTWGIFILLSLMGLSAVYLVFDAARRAGRGIFLSVFISLVFVGLFTHPLIVEGGNMTRQVTASLTVGIFYLVLYRPRSPFHSVVAGALTGIIFFTQQNEILGSAMALAVWIFFSDQLTRNPSRQIVRNIFFHIAGFCIPLLFMAVVIFRWENFTDFMEQAFWFNMNDYIQKDPFPLKLYRLLSAFVQKAGAAKMLLFTLLLILWGLPGFRKPGYAQIVMGVGFIFQVISSATGGRIYGHYFLMFVPCLVFILILVSVKWERRIWKFVYVPLLAILVFQVWYAYTGITYNRKFAPERLLREVAEVSGQRGQFYSFDPQFLRVNYQLGIAAPAKWIYHHFSPSDSVIRQEIVDDLCGDLHKWKTSYVLMTDQHTKLYPEIQYLLDTEYVCIQRETDYSLYRRLGFPPRSGDGKSKSRPLHIDK